MTLSGPDGCGASMGMWPRAEPLRPGARRFGEASDLRGGRKLAHCLAERTLQPRRENDKYIVVDAVKYLLGLLEETVAKVGDCDRVPPCVPVIAFAADECSLFKVVERGHY